MLLKLAPFGLRERVKILAALYPDFNITLYRLQRLYKDNGVKFKIVGHKRCWRREEDEANIAKDDEVHRCLKVRVRHLLD